MVHKGTRDEEYIAALTVPHGMIANVKDDKHSQPCALPAAVVQPVIASAGSASGRCPGAAKGPRSHPQVAGLS